MKSIRRESIRFLASCVIVFCTGTLILCCDDDRRVTCVIIAEVIVLCPLAVPLYEAMWLNRKRRPRLDATTKAVFSPGEIAAIMKVATETVINHPTTAVGLIVAMQREGRLADRGIHAGNGIRSIEETARIMHARHEETDRILRDIYDKAKER